MILKQKIEKLNNIIGIILNILIIIVTILIVIGSYYIFQIKIQKKDYANIFGYTFFEIATGSMSPTINVGDVVIVKIGKEIRKNDIIVYNEENNFITHRVIEIENNTLKTKGDANNSEDKPITIDNVLGKVEKIIPKLGIYKKILNTPEILILIILLIIVFSIFFMYSSNTEEKNDK